MVRKLVDRALSPVLLFLHFLLTRGAALVILGVWVWYLSPSFNWVSQYLELGVEKVLAWFDTIHLIKLIILQSKPEMVLLFMIILVPLYVIFSFVLYPLRHNWIRRTTLMVLIHFLALITLYTLAWFSQDIMAWSGRDLFNDLMNTALWMRDGLFDLLGYSDFSERLKAFIRLVEPRSILAVILITAFFYLLFALPGIVGNLLYGTPRPRTGDSERKLFS